MGRGGQRGRDNSSRNNLSHDFVPHYDDASHDHQQLFYCEGSNHSTHASRDQSPRGRKLRARGKPIDPPWNFIEYARLNKDSAKIKAEAGSSA
jgi:hypothetical protein